jgi:putative endonuclease
MPAKTFHVYLLASRTRVLYVGVTSYLAKRIWEHKHKAIPGFQGWLRAKKVASIEAENPQWRDLSGGWFDTERPDPSLRSG